MSEPSSSLTFLARHEFLLRRLMSLTGMVPVGAYLVVHLATNASVLGGWFTFQKNVDTIHSLGALLPLVEWAFIFLPILFHAVIGLVIIWGGMPNTADYPYGGNIRYTLQRATGIIAFLFIAFHIWHLHHYGAALGGGKFDPRHATSSTAAALDSAGYKVAYVVGVVASVFHLANGIWTAGITWGVWTSVAAMRRAGYLCAVFGVTLGIVGLSAMSGFGDVNVKETKAKEERRNRVRDFEEGNISAEQLHGPAGASTGTND